jgi:hypothetical protein
MIPPAIETGLLIGITLGLLGVGRTALRNWRMALRRENLLLLIAATYEARMRGEVEDEAGAYHLTRLHVALADELHAQQHWRRIPPIGEPWPESTEPAPLVTR